MTTTIPPQHDDSGPQRPADALARARVSRRLRPLFIASALQGINLWVSVEKLFMKQIGFDAAKLGLMVAAYAALVPVLEIPSGILADRWSRRNVLMIANGALAASALVGGLAHSVATYTVAALLLGVFFAMQSGTVDSIVFDLLLEETGTSDGFERTMGRLRIWDSVTLVGGALGGGAIAAAVSPRITYFLTVPFVVASIPVLARLREPRLNRESSDLSVGDQVRLTYRTIVRQRSLRPIIGGMVLAALLLQALLEFGPLWMVALAAPALLFGPQWAGLMSALGLGGYLAGRFDLDKPAPRRAALSLLIGAAAILTITHAAVTVIAAQIVIAATLVMISTYLTRRLHDSIDSSIRSGVSSGVGTLTWTGFLPFAITFGLLTRHYDVHVAGLLMVAVALGTAAIVTHLVAERPIDARETGAPHEIAPDWCPSEPPMSPEHAVLPLAPTCG